MGFEFTLNRLATRIAVMLLALAGCAFMGWLVVCGFITGMLTDERVAAGRDVLGIAVEYFPNSPRLFARLAEAEMADTASDLAAAEAHAMRAASLSPSDYRAHLLLATIRESRGDRAAAEDSLRTALKLAPGKVDLRWRMANLLVRQGKINQSLAEFNLVLLKNPKLVGVTLDLVWRASNGDLDSMKTVTANNPKAGIVLALFLAKQSRLEDAVSAFKQPDRGVRLESQGSGALLTALIQAGALELAHEAWLDLFTARIDRTDSGEPAVVWNGGFENEPLQGLLHFDWQQKNSDYARVRVERGVAHRGLRSLKIEFSGKDTTRLDQEARQMIVVRPGARYRLECYVKPVQLVSPEGPRVVLTAPNSAVWIAETDPVPVGSGEWRLLSVEFTAPADARALLISVKRKPRFSYDEPTKGAVFFDDFSVSEVSAVSMRRAGSSSDPAAASGGTR